MRRLMRLFVPVAAAMVGVALLAPPALANTVVKTVNHVDATYVEKGVCSFHLSVHLEGFYKSVDYYDGSGFLYKEINTSGGGGPFSVTYSAHGTTLTQRNEAFSEMITFHRDGTWTYTRRGPVAKFTVPGGGIVLLDTGTATWSEPDETLLFSGGPHQAADGDFDAFCAAFG
jgi:hypothetical protein